VNRLLERVAARPLWLLLALLAAFWPVWRWYLARLDDGSDEPWAALALAAALFVSWPARELRLVPTDALLRVAAGFTLLYAAMAPFAPPLVRAVLAMAALACVWTSVAGARARLPVALALSMLSLPVIASLQFYAGFPLRVLTAAGATQMLQLAGLEVVRAGTSMELDGRLVLVDAPCSGVRMAWTACVLCCVLLGQRSRVTWGALFVALAFALPVVLFANAARAAALFLLETSGSAPSDVLHSLVGILTFALVAVGLLASDRLQRRWSSRGPRGSWAEAA
jgi:exosortase